MIGALQLLANRSQAGAVPANLIDIFVLSGAKLKPAGAECLIMQYIGTELDVFAIAVNWKKYVRDMLQRYIHGAVLEVGAGKGSFTIALAKVECTGWLCLEPDPALSERNL